MVTCIAGAGGQAVGLRPAGRSGWAASPRSLPARTRRTPGRSWPRPCGAQQSAADGADSGDVAQPGLAGQSSLTALPKAGPRERRPSMVPGYQRPRAPDSRPPPEFSLIRTMNRAAEFSRSRARHPLVPLAGALCRRLVRRRVFQRAAPTASAARPAPPPLPARSQVRQSVPPAPSPVSTALPAQYSRTGCIRSWLGDYKAACVRT